MTDKNTGSHLDLSGLHDPAGTGNNTPHQQPGLKITLEASNNANAAQLATILRWHRWGSWSTVFWATFVILFALAAWEGVYRLGHDPKAIAWVERKYPGKTILQLPNWPISLVKKAFSPSGPGWPDDLPPPNIVLSDLQLQDALDRMTSHVGVVADWNVDVSTLTLNDPYFQKWKDIAVRESYFGIPPSVTLMQGRLESAAGTSNLAKNGNHFGMKKWTAQTIIVAGKRLERYLPTVTNPKHKEILTALLKHIRYVEANITWYSTHNDDSPNDSFVNFATPDASYAAHTLLILFGTKKVKSSNSSVEPYQSRYISLLLAGDFAGACAVLKAADYATSTLYHQHLIDWITKTGLNQLDAVFNKEHARDVHDAVQGYFASLG